MNPATLDKLKGSWLKKQKELMQKGRLRRYLHFDRVIKDLNPDTIRNITNPSYIKEHSFFPLLQKVQSNRLYKRNPDSKERSFERKNRMIAYASHEDALIYSWYTKILEENYEKKLHNGNISDCVIAYRKLDGKSNVDFAKEVFEEISSKEECATINLDIEGFFDNLDHALLKKCWKDNLEITDLPPDHYAVYKSIIHYNYVRLREVKKLFKLDKSQRKPSLIELSTLNFLRFKNKIKKNKIRGIPQGLPVSCILSNMYMHDIDLSLYQKTKKMGGFYRRYSDDIVLICPSDEVEKLKKYISDLVLVKKLKIQPSKTEVRYFKREGGQMVSRNEKNNPAKFQYLGIEYDGRNTSLRHKGYAKYERKMSRAIRREIETSMQNGRSIRKKRIYENYSHLGMMNYLSYGRRATKKLGVHASNKHLRKSKIMKKISQKFSK